MTNPSWILLTAPAVALAIGVLTVWAALIGNRRTNDMAQRIARLASYTTFEASCTKDRLDTATRFLDAIAEVLEDPQHETKHKVWSEFHRVQVVFHPGGAPVDIAQEMQRAVADLMTHDELRPSADTEELEKLRLVVDQDRWMAEDHGSDEEPEYQWLLDAVTEFRHRDARAIQDKTGRPDFEHEVYQIEQQLWAQGPHSWLDVRLLLGSAAARVKDDARRRRNEAAIAALRKGRNDFVAAAGEWVNNPPTLREVRSGIDAFPLSSSSSRR